MREEALNRDKAKLAKVAGWNFCILITLVGATSLGVSFWDAANSKKYGDRAAVDVSKLLGCFNEFSRYFCDRYIESCNFNDCEIKTRDAFYAAARPHEGEILKSVLPPVLIGIIAVQGAVNAVWIIPTLCRYACLRCCGKVALSAPSDSLLGEDEFASGAVVEVEDSKGCWARLIGRSRRDNEVPLLVTGEGMDGVEQEEKSGSMCVIL